VPLTLKTEPPAGAYPFLETTITFVGPDIACSHINKNFATILQHSKQHILKYMSRAAPPVDNHVALLGAL